MSEINNTIDQAMKGLIEQTGAEGYHLILVGKEGELSITIDGADYDTVKDMLAIATYHNEKTAIDEAEVINHPSLES